MLNLQNTVLPVSSAGNIFLPFYFPETFLFEIEIYIILMFV